MWSGATTSETLSPSGRTSPYNYTARGGTTLYSPLPVTSALAHKATLCTCDKVGDSSVEKPNVDHCT